MIVHNTGKYPTREILYRDYDYLDKVRISQNSNCKTKGPLAFDKQLSRETKIYSHLGHYESRGQEDNHNHL